MQQPRFDVTVERFVGPRSDRGVRVGIGTVIAVVGLVLVGLLLTQAAQGYAGLFELLLGGVFPLGLAAVVTASGAGLAVSSVDSRSAAHVGLWWIVGSVVAATTGVAILLFENANGVALSGPVMIVAGNAATGGLGGIVVGLTAARRARVVREREREREQLADEREKLALLNRIVRHDIGNDLQVISGTAEYLDEHVDPEGRAPLERLQQTTAEAIELTEQVRTFVQALDEDGVERQPISLRRVLRTQLGNARERYPDAMVTVDGEIPDVEVLADELLATVVSNLVANAVEHSDRDAPRVELQVDLTPATARLRVTDDGPGVPDGLEDSLFERDEHGGASSGTGIGLYIVDTLVERYGGDVWVENGTDSEDALSGATFVVELPRSRAVDPHDASEPVEGSSTGQLVTSN